MSKDIMIGKVQKNKNETLFIKDNQYKDSRFIDIRVHFKDKNGIMKPTKKGLSIPGEILNIITKMVNNHLAT